MYPGMRVWLLRMAWLLVWSYMVMPDAMATAASMKTELHWLKPDDSSLEVRGLPFLKENGVNWWRLPARAKETVPDYVFETAKATTGGRIRLRCNTSCIALRYHQITPLQPTPNLSIEGFAGIDLYADGKYVSTHIPPGTGTAELMLCEGLAPRIRDFCIYLPLFSEVKVEAVGVAPGTVFEAVTPFANSKPVVFYGTSITHGGCADRPGMSYEALLSRRLNVDFVNLGLNGCGRGEPAVMELLAEIDAACFVLDYSQNQKTVEDLETAYGPSIDILRHHHPETPILCITPIYWTPELPGSERSNTHEAMREVIRQAVSERCNRGDHHLHLMEGHKLLGPDKGDGLVDGLHPNTLGYYWMAEGLAPVLADILGVKVKP